MNPYYRFAAWTGGGSLVAFLLAAIESTTGLIGRIAPTEAHALAWLCIVVLAVPLARAARHLRLPAFGLKWPTPKYARQRRYATRQRRIVP